MRIIFFGSTEFSLPIVRRLHERYEIAGVVTARARPQGRGLQVVASRVAAWAAEKDLKVHEPDDPNRPEFVAELAAARPDLFVLSAYGHILGAELLKVPRLGGVNIHPSLLPRFRGAAPIQRAIMSGEEKTGITFFFMDEKIDHGKIIAQQELAIEPADTGGTLSGRLAELASTMVVGIVDSIADGTCRQQVQDEGAKVYAAKLRKEEVTVNWQDTTRNVFNLIRALTPYPGAKAKIHGREITITRAAPSDRKIGAAVCHIEDKKLFIGTQDGAIVVEELKPENKKTMTGLDFINGFRIREGEKIA